MARRNTLPNKASDLIEVAVNDLTKVERNKKYKVNMNVWHTPLAKKPYDENGMNTEVTAENFKVCEVCFAGAVISQTLGVDILENTYLSTYYDRGDDELVNKLEALNDFCTGDVYSGLHELTGVSFSTAMNRKIVRYSKRNSAKFKQQMRKLAKDLRAVGL